MCSSDLCYAEEVATSDRCKPVISGLAEDTRCLLQNLIVSIYSKLEDLEILLLTSLVGVFYFDRSHSK